MSLGSYDDYVGEKMEGGNVVSYAASRGCASNLFERAILLIWI